MINVVGDKNLMYVKKKFFWNPATCSCKNGKYAARIMEDSRIIYKKVIRSYYKDVDAEAKLNNEAKLNDETKAILTNFNGEKATCKTQNFYAKNTQYFITSLLITVVLLIAVNIYCFC